MTTQTFVFCIICQTVSFRFLFVCYFEWELIAAKQPSNSVKSNQGCSLQASGQKLAVWVALFPRLLKHLLLPKYPAFVLAGKSGLKITVKAGPKNKQANANEGKKKLLRSRMLLVERTTWLTLAMCYIAATRCYGNFHITVKLYLSSLLLDGWYGQIYWA